MANFPAVIWKKRILIPFWIVRICVMLFMLVLYGIAIKMAKDDDSLVTPRVGAVVVFMLFIVAVLLIDILAIILFLRDALRPGVFLIMNSFQTGFWTGSLIVDIVYIARGRDGVHSAAIAISVFIWLTYVGLLIYAIVKNNKHKKEMRRGNYAPALNPAAPPAPGYHPPAYMNAAPYQQQDAAAYHNTSYVPPAQHGAAAGYYNEAPVKPAQMV